MVLTAQQIQEKKAQITGPGAFFEVEDARVEGRIYRRYKHAANTLVEVFQNGRNHGDLEFLVYREQRLTYADFYREVDAVAAALQSLYDVAPGDRVAIAMRNNPQWSIAYTAATLVGAIVVPINSWGQAAELRYALEDSGSTVLVCDPHRYQLAKESLGSLGVRAVIVDEDAKHPEQRDDDSADWSQLLAQGADVDCAVHPAAPDDPCVILYTSGSTGFPKGVLHRHIAVTQSLMNMMFLGYLVMELEGSREFRGGAERETPLLTVPLFHSTGLLAGHILPLATGQKVVMMYKWDPLVAMKLIEEEKITGISSVPAVLQDLLSHPAFNQHNTTSLIRLGAAGAATPAGLPDLIRKKVGDSSRSAGYGMTETMAVCATMSGALFDFKPNSSGLVSPIMEVRCVDPQGDVLPQGVDGGEIEMYSVCCAAGYWDKPEASAITFAESGWMKTGDIGRLDDDGFIHITGRIKEIVIRGGENIYPGEIEQVAYELPQVQEVVVFGVPDEAMGEELVLVLYLVQGRTLEEEELRRFLASRLAAYKVPRHVLFSTRPLPQNASGKLHKRDVREAFITAMDERIGSHDEG